MPGEPVVRVLACIERKDDTIGGYSQFSPLVFEFRGRPFRFGEQSFANPPPPHSPKRVRN
jgi:hypothetical protein